MAYGLKIYDTEGNTLLDTADRPTRLFYTGVVNAGESGTITVSGINSTSEAKLDIWEEEIKRWWRGDYGYVSTQTYPGIEHHGDVQGYCDTVSGTNDFYTYWYDYWAVENPSNWSWFKGFVEMVIGDTIVSGTTVATVSGSNQTRWNTLYTASKSGNHPYDTTNVPDNLNEIKTQFSAEGYDDTWYTIYLGLYSSFTAPFTATNGETQSGWLVDMADEVFSQHTFYFTDTIIGYAKALDPNQAPHIVTFAVIGDDLKITYSANNRSSGPGAWKRYMYNGDSIIYVVGYM